MLHSIRIALLAGLAPLLVVACGGSAPDLNLPQPRLPAEPTVVTVDQPAFEGRITLSPWVVAETRLRELVEPRARAALSEVQVQASKAPELPEGAPDYRYHCYIEWTATPVGGRYLNVVGRTSQFTGGAHPIHAVEAFVWDRLTNRRLTLADVLADATSGSDALEVIAQDVRTRVIEKKSANWAEYDPATDIFIGGPDGGLAPTPGNFANFNFAPPDDSGETGGLVFFYSPYDVGPYSDGEYVVTVPAAVAGPLLDPGIRVGL